MKTSIVKRFAGNIGLLATISIFVVLLLYLTVFWIEEIRCLKPFYGAAHVMSFFILTFLMCEFAYKIKAFKSPGRIVFAIIIIAFLAFGIGVAIEAMQFPIQRDADFMDLLLDWIGIFMAIIIFLKLKSDGLVKSKTADSKSDEQNSSN